MIESFAEKLTFPAAVLYFGFIDIKFDNWLDADTRNIGKKEKQKRL